jgi:formylglycine-generating enzyme required for sulfatase activity
MSTTIAIDFGTTRTKLAYVGTKGETELMRFQREDPFLPSLCYLPKGSDAIFWGHDAEEMKMHDPAGVIPVLKRKLHERAVRANHRAHTPLELLTALFRNLRERSARELPALAGTLPKSLYLTVPALYGPSEEKLMRQAAKAVGFADEGVALIPEPVAAARAWLAETAGSADSVVVLDCGGGTIDWAWLRRDGDGFALATECPPGGDRNVGGHDVDLELLQLLLEQLDDTDAEQVESRRLHYLHELRGLKERYSRGLPLTPIRVGGAGVELAEDLVQDALTQRFVDHAVEGLRSYLDQVKEQTKGAAPPVLLVGGSARIKGLKEAIGQACGCETQWWERSEYATVLGALEVKPAPKPGPTPSPAPTPLELPVPQDIHGWATMRSRLVKRLTPSGFLGLGTKEVVESIRELDDPSRVQDLQQQVAQILGLSIAFRDRLKGGGEGPEMVVIPPGRFLMGSPASEPERSDNEGPQHAVTLTKPFALARYALTFAEYDAYCEATGKEKPGDAGWGRGNRPVINVSWDDAVAYCLWLSEQTGEEYRLPSEAQWEYACRAGTTTPFWWGDAISPQQANYDGNDPYNKGAKGEYRHKTLPVDELEPNPWGLHQMQGNVWEWVQDWYASYSKEVQEDPIYAQSGSFRVGRGGSWVSVAGDLRAACRPGGGPGVRVGHLGFRPARTL